MNNEFIAELKSFNIPTCLRVCAGTDGSVTFLLEIITGHSTAVITKYQHIIAADNWMAAMFGVAQGSKINDRVVSLACNNIPYVYAHSLSAIENMPKVVKCDMIKADIPIGKILRDHNIETRRDFEYIDLNPDEILFDTKGVLSRSYKIIHKNGVLMWINEKFPVDNRWIL